MCVLDVVTNCEARVVSPTGVCGVSRQASIRAMSIQWALVGGAGAGPRRPGEGFMSQPLRVAYAGSTPGGGSTASIYIPRLSERLLVSATIFRPGRCCACGLSSVVTRVS